MAAAKIVGTFETEIRNTKVLVSVDTEGRFLAAIGEKRFSAYTFDDLRGSLMTHTKKITTRVAVPATYITTAGSYGGPLVAVPVTLTGIHAKDGDVLFRYDDTGKTDRASAGGMRSWFLAPMSPAERTLYGEKAKAKAEAQKDLEVFEKQYEFRAPRAVEEAIAAVTDEEVSTK